MISMKWKDGENCRYNEYKDDDINIQEFRNKLKGE